VITALTVHELHSNDGPVNDDSFQRIVKDAGPHLAILRKGEQAGLLDMEIVLIHLADNLGMVGAGYDCLPRGDNVLDRSVLDHALSGFEGDQKKKAGAIVFAKYHFMSLTKAFHPIEKRVVFDLIESLPYLPDAEGSCFGTEYSAFIASRSRPCLPDADGSGFGTRYRCTSLDALKVALQHYVLGRFSDDTDFRDAGAADLASGDAGFATSAYDDPSFIQVHVVN